MAKAYTTRTTVQILGVGKLMRGTSEKTKKDYHFQEVSFGFPHGWMEGLRCGHSSVDGASLTAVNCGETGLSVGDIFDAVVTVNEFGEYGKVSYLKTDLLPETDSYLLVILSCTYNGLFGEGGMTEDATSLMVYKGVQYVLKNGIFSPENVVDGDDVFQILDGKMEFTDE